MSSCVVLSRSKTGQQGNVQQTQNDMQTILGHIQDRTSSSVSALRSLSDSEWESIPFPWVETGGYWRPNDDECDPVHPENWSMNLGDSMSTLELGK